MGDVPVVQCRFFQMVLASTQSSDTRTGATASPAARDGEGATMITELPATRRFSAND